MNYPNSLLFFMFLLRGRRSAQLLKMEKMEMACLYSFPEIAVIGFN